MRKTFITKMPDKAGSFLAASKVISEAGVNITRVSYNKAVDTHTLFIDVVGEDKQINIVTKDLTQLGYLLSNDIKAKVILLEFKLYDKPGSVLPILEIINSYDFNISYISSQENSTEYQYFKMGLFIDNTADIKSFLEQVAELCEVKIIDYNKSEKTLDNTVFYLSFANEIARKLSLNRDDTNALIADSNLIMQMLDNNNKSPYKTFEYIGKFADYLAKYKGNGFNARISKRIINENIILHLIEPPCGSNTYILQSNQKLLFIDSGFALYKDEMKQIFHSLFSDFDNMQKEIIITHVDIDHCGLLNMFDKVYLSQKSYDNFVLENKGEDNFREQNITHAPYCRISKILSGYINPSLEKLSIINTQDPDDNDISLIGNFEFEGLQFEVYQGNGGHVDGEIVFLCNKEKLIFTGDILVNVAGFSKEQSSFNLLAPYLMTSVNMDSQKSTRARTAVFSLISEGKWLVCGGHGTFFDYAQ